MGPAITPSPFHKLHNALLVERSPAFAYGLAVLLAIMFIACLFPLSFLAGHGAFFENGDASQHVAGWKFFAKDSWHFPLLHTDRLNHPSGTSIAFTDSIPVAALLFKLVAGWWPDFHYLGLWHAVAFVTQALAAVFLIRVLDARHALAALCAAFFALTWPALLWRIGHPSLMTQGIILTAFAFYFLGRQGKWSSNAASGALIVLNLLGLTVHPYFLAFCYPIFLAFLIEQAIGSEGWKRQLTRFLASVVAIIAVGVLLGYFGHGATTTFGYGYYSTNLSTPFCGGQLIACARDALQHQFAEYRFADATGGQYEGYNYFGAGVLLLAPFALAAYGRELLKGPTRYPALTVILLLFVGYAVTNLVYFGAREILSFPLPAVFDRLTGTFRASGRFIWPVGYLLLFAILAPLLKARSATALLLLAVSVPLQWVDVQLLRERVAMKASAPPAGDLEQWSGVMATVNTVNIYPAFGCGDADVNVYWFFQRLAAEYGKLLDTGYIARPNVDCEGNTRAFSGQFAKDQLYVMPADYLNNPFIIPAGFRAASGRGECAEWRVAVICKAGADWENSGLKTVRIAPIKDHGEWPAAMLRTQIGILQNGRLVPATKNKAGFLSFGPYIVLPPGRYHYAIEYASRVDASQQVGRWDIVMSGTGSGREIAAGAMHGTEGAQARIEGTFDSDGAKLPLEIRTFFAGSGDLQVVGIALKKVSQ